MTRAEQRRLATAEAEVTRLRAEVVRQAEIINKLIHETAAQQVSIDAALEALHEAERHIIHREKK